MKPAPHLSPVAGFRNAIRGFLVVADNSQAGFLTRTLSRNGETFYEGNLNLYHLRVYWQMMVGTFCRKADRSTFILNST